MSKTKKSKTFIKIIYFDEGSATDLLYILGGGKSTDKEEKIVTKTTQLAAGAEAQAGAKINLLTKITAGMGIDGSADASREGRSILSKAIESTVLTDYISGYDIVKSDATVSATTSLKVYDVILAGVCV